LLKVTNDQPKEDVESQVAALLLLQRAVEAPPTCYPQPRADGIGHVSMVGGSPSILLDFLDGMPADKVVVAATAAGDVGGDGGVVARVLRGAGSALGKLHTVPVPSEAELAAASIRDAGGPGRYPGVHPAAACNVGFQQDYAAEWGLVTSFSLLASRGSDDSCTSHAHSPCLSWRQTRAKIGPLLSQS
jgi:hypothetical protein